MRERPAFARIPDDNKPPDKNIKTDCSTPANVLEINLLITLDLREQAALQSALVTHGAPDALVTLALTGACRISSVAEARRLKEWLREARTAGNTDFAALQMIERALVTFGL